ncbi:MAG: DUF2275 domain-containing protein [Candidatus Aquicultor sp.]
MTCQEIQNLLPAFLEDLLPPENKKSIKSHLASCILCYRSLEALKRGEDLVKGLEEVEPPPFFEQRIMARVREEAGRKQGILRKFFYPLHIKIPIQAMATVLIAVLAFYVYQKNEPEMKQRTPFPIPLTESGKSQIKAETPKAPAPPSVVSSPRRAPAAALLDKGRQRFAAPPQIVRSERGDRAADLTGPKLEGSPLAEKSEALITVSREKEVSPAGAQALGRTQGGVEKKEAAEALGALPSEQKRKGKMAETSALAEKDQILKAAPAASKLMAAPAKKQMVVDITIQVGDAAVAVGEIEDHLGQTGGRIIENLRRAGGIFLKTEIPAQKLENFLGRLEAVGRVNLNKNVINLPDGKVTVNIQIVTTP